MAITLKQARVGVDKTQQEIADALNIHVQTYAKYEEHPEKMSIDMAEKFARVVGLDMNDIIFLPKNSN